MYTLIYPAVVFPKIEDSDHVKYDHFGSIFLQDRTQQLSGLSWSFPSLVISGEAVAHYQLKIGDKSTFGKGCNG